MALIGGKAGPDGGAAAAGLGTFDGQLRRRGSSGRWRRSAALVVGFALLALAMGCSSGGDGGGAAGADADAPTPQPGGRLVVAVPLREPETILRLVLEPLTTFAADGSVAPYLAESVEPNETFDRWTITVRPGISFHNGEPLDAEAVKANLDTYSVSEVYGTDPLSPIVSTTVVDDRTVEVELAQPWASFPAHLTAEQSDGTGLIAAPETLEQAGPLFLADPAASDLYGTGPFTLEDSEASADQWLARKNPDYWQEGLPYLDEIEIRTVPERSTRMSDLESGDIDVAVTSGPDPEGGSNSVLTQTGDLQVLAVALNTRRAPLDDPRVREALAAATDVEALAETAGIDPSMIAAGPFGPESPWTDPPVARVPFDPERARELVDAYEAEVGPISIRLGAQDLEVENVAVQQQLAQQWSDAGIDVEISVVDPFEQTAKLLVTADFDAVMGRLFGMPDPDLYYFWWHSSALKTEGKGAGHNFVGLDDEALDQALDDARATEDEGERRAAMATVQERLAEVNPYVWLWATRWSAVTNERVQGLDDAPLPDGGTRWPMLGPRLNLEAVWLAQ